MSAIFDRWLDIKKEIELFDSKRLSGMIFRKNDSLLLWSLIVKLIQWADACLELQSRRVKKKKKTLFHFTYEDKCNAYQQYWDKN